LALVHRPRVLFLDEPTTGLDPQSRADLWHEVRRLSRVDGVTVFLTTQYLEEADMLADRVGIIDAGRIVTEGRPEDLKAQIGRPSVEVTPTHPHERERMQAVLERFGAPSAAAPGNVSVQLERGAEALTDVVRVLDDEDLSVRSLELHQPSLDDVFLSRTGRKLDTEAHTGYAADRVAVS
jgi:ABC-2 type transport system ATP-binding protein